jgi:hypothetical protein
VGGGTHPSIRRLHHRDRNLEEEYRLRSRMSDRWRPPLSFEKNVMGVGANCRLLHSIILKYWRWLTYMVECTPQVVRCLSFLYDLYCLYTLQFTMLSV